MKQLGRNREIAFSGEPFGDVANVSVYAERLLEHQQAGARFARRMSNIGAHGSSIAH